MCILKSISLIGCVLLCLCLAAHGQGVWQPPAALMQVDIPAGNKQITKTGEVPMIGNGPWTIQFNLKQPGDVQVDKHADNTSHGKIARHINQVAKKKNYKIEIKRQIEPLLGDFESYSDAIEDLHQQINYQKTYNDKAEAWNRNKKASSKKAQQYLKQNKISLGNLGPQEIKDLTLRMQIYDKNRDVIDHLSKQMLKRLNWKRVIGDFKPQSTASMLARDYFEYRSLELIKERLIQNAEANNTDWQSLVQKYFDHLKIEVPQDLKNNEKRLLQKVDALQIILNGRLKAWPINRKRFNSAFKAQEKDALSKTITFKWHFSMWPLAHPSDPNSWIKGAIPVPANLRNAKGVNLMLYGELDPANNDSADWWKVAGINKANLEIEFEAFPKRQAELIGPIEVQTTVNQPKQSHIRIAAKGIKPVRYRIKIAPRNGSKQNVSTEFHEPVSNPNPGSPF